VELPELQQIVGGVVLDAFDEAVGASRRRWALVFVAFVGGAVTFWMIRRRRRARDVEEASAASTEAAG
jgi:hypothetical protein